MNELSMHRPDCDCDYHAELALAQALDDLARGIRQEIREVAA